MIFDKKALTVEEQVALLKERGMLIPNEAKAKMYLSNISYYRLSAYWYTFLEDPKTDHLFSNGTTFDIVLDTYVFDRKLRLMIFDEIERIEIALRTTIIHNFCLQYLKNCDARKKVAQHFGLDEHVLESWLETLAYVRNTCAHHMRVWNRKLPRTPILPRNTKYIWLKEVPSYDKVNRIYIVVAAINYLLSAISPGNSFSKKVKELLNKYPALPKHYMGFTPNWDKETLWK